MDILIALALMLAVMLTLWLVIRYDQNRIKNSTPPPLSREVMRKGFTPGASVQWKVQAGVALMGLIG